MNPWVDSFAGCCFGPLSHSTMLHESWFRPFRADDEIRTRDPNLGKVVLYQLSHIRMSLFKTTRTLTDLGNIRQKDKPPPGKGIQAEAYQKCYLDSIVTEGVGLFTVYNSVNTSDFILCFDPEANGLLYYPSDNESQDEGISQDCSRSNSLL